MLAAVRWPGTRLAICGALLLLGAGCYVWQALVLANSGSAACGNEFSGSLAWAAAVAVTGAGILARKAWAEYFLYAYTIVFAVMWVAEVVSSVATTTSDTSTLSLMISLVPGIGFMVLLLAVVWQVRKGYRKSR